MTFTPDKLPPTCKNCANSFGRDRLMCNVTYDLVTGEKAALDCRAVREAGGWCGPAGTLFEKKLPNQ